MGIGRDEVKRLAEHDGFIVARGRLDAKRRWC